MCCPGRGAAAGLRLELRERDAELRQRAEELRRREEQCARLEAAGAAEEAAARRAAVDREEARAHEAGQLHAERLARAAATRELAESSRMHGSAEQRLERALVLEGERTVELRALEARALEAHAVDRESRQESRALRDSGRRLRGEAEEQAALLNACRQESEAASRLEAQEARLLLASLRQEREADEARRSAAEARSRQRCEQLQEELEGMAEELRAERREVRCERQAAEVREQARLLLEAELHRRTEAEAAARDRLRVAAECQTSPPPAGCPEAEAPPQPRCEEAPHRAPRGPDHDCERLQPHPRDWKFAAASSSIQGLRCLLRDAQRELRDQRRSCLRLRGDLALCSSHPGGPLGPPAKGGVALDRSAELATASTTLDLEDVSFATAGGSSLLSCGAGRGVVLAEPVADDGRYLRRQRILDEVAEDLRAGRGRLAAARA